MTIVLYQVISPQHRPRRQGKDRLWQLTLQAQSRFSSIDGGGIRGIIPAIILDALQQQIGAELYTVFDLISGTSTGGIIALGIGTACKAGAAYAPAELLNLYVQNGAAIFHKPLVPLIHDLNGPKYSPEPLEACLLKFFGATKFSSALTPLLDLQL